MVAVVSSTGLGLFHSSLTQLGRSFGGRAAVGQQPHGAYVNVATGNLILRSLDESVQYRGLNLEYARTYNSQGALQAGTDSWNFGLDSSLVIESATRIVRRGADGSSVAYETVGKSGIFQSTAGDGAHDTITIMDKGNIVWTDGSSLRTEEYDESGRLWAFSDRNGLRWTIGRDRSIYANIQTIESASGTRINFSYDQSNQLVWAETYERNELAHAVRYGYDAQGRLTQAQTMLDPHIATHNHAWFTTTYGYEGTSQRISSVTQSDGVAMQFLYDAWGRVRQVTTGSGADAQVLTYTYEDTNRITRVTDGANQQWVYQYDLKGQLQEVRSPAIAGQSMVSRYGYDADGNLSFVEQGHIVGSNPYVVVERTDYEYDGSGNLLWERDALGNSVQRTYNWANQLVSVTRYTDRDPDGAGSGRPVQGQTERLVYDSLNNLRYRIDAVGGVQKFNVDLNGQVVRELAFLSATYTGAADFAALETWSAQQTGPQSVVDYTYDFRGLLAVEERYAVSNRSQIDAGSQTITLAGASTAAQVWLGDTDAQIIAYTYDPKGQLAQKIVYRGASRQIAEVTSLTYDGMGRLLSTLDASGRSTSVVHDDVGNRIITTLASGIIRIEARNSAGLLRNVSESGAAGGGVNQTRSSSRYYDTRGLLRASSDVVGALQFHFYDEAGRLSAEVDATGAVTRYTRDHAGRVTETRLYATRLNITGWSASNPPATLSSPPTHADDRSTQSLYNTAGQLTELVDGEGTRSRYVYDGAGRLVRSEQISAVDAGDQRRTRLFYDNVGRLVATLDAENYLSEHVYDQGGRLVKEVRYANRAAAANLETATLSQLRPLADAADQTTRHYYDGRGQLLGTLDAERYLTRHRHIAADNELWTLRYANRASGTITDATTLDDLVGTLSGSRIQFDADRWNATGEKVFSERAGLLTNYSYDTAGRLTGTSEQDIDDLNAWVFRRNERRLNAFGEVIAELSPEGASRLQEGMTQAQIDAIWAQWGVKHSYDLRGRRIETTDAHGHKTWYFYDREDRLEKTLRGIANSAGTLNAEVEVQHVQYNAHGEVASTLNYTGRLTLSAPTYAAAQALAGALPPAGAADTRIDLTYNRRGQLRTESDPVAGAGSVRKTLDYNGFGELKQTTLSRMINGVLGAQIDTYSYDKRGLQSGSVTASGSLQIEQSVIRDAFGRIRTSTDARGNQVTYSYDKLGRQVQRDQWVQGRLERSMATWDAFERKLTETDALGRVTTYSYETGTVIDHLRTVVTTPEGVTVTTQKNRRGLTLKVTDAQNATTIYRYDLEGRLKSEVDALNGATQQVYDERGLLITATDASGRRIAYTYDAAGRTLTRTENAQDPNPANHLITQYRYDGQGRQIRVTDASGKQTHYTYDPAGRVLTVTRGDAAQPQLGLEVETYTYDAQGQQLTVTVGSGSNARTTKYLYDAAGRRTQEIVDPDGLKITTVYEYDRSGNVIARHNAVYGAGSSASASTPPGVTRYVYDEADRVLFEIDPNNTITRYFYDANGQTTASRVLAQPASSLPAGALTVAQVQAALSANDGRDVQIFTLRDADGRVRMVFNADGSWVRFSYDNRSRLIETVTSSNTWTLNAAERAALESGATTVSGQNAVSYFQARFDAAVGSQPRRSFQTYDAVGRVEFSLTEIEGGLAVVGERGYDAAGRVTSETRYAVTIAYNPSQTSAQVRSAVAAAGGTAASQNRRTQYLHDGAGRLQFTLEDSEVRADGQYFTISQVTYDGAGRVFRSISYREQLKPASLTLAGVQAAVNSAAVSYAVENGYDAAGRRTSVKDAAGFTERYGYDASGALISYTDRENFTWNYVVDKAGRRVREQTPQVKVSFVDQNGGYAELNRHIYNRTDYDALGNVIRRREDVNEEQIAGNFSNRITEYEYDNRGHQILTRFPRAGRLDQNGLVLSFDGETQPTQTVRYDALGRAVAQQNTRGFWSYKVYDKEGRVRFEIDEERYVTEYRYNVFGEQTQLIRYANPASVVWSDGSTVPTLEQMVAGVALSPDAARDRTLTTVYDRRGLKQSVLQDTIAYRDSNGTERTDRPETRYQYDAYGRLVKESVLLERLPSERWAESFHYYDEAGRKVLSVDAERFVTTWKYDGRGLVTEQKEYARALAAAPSSTTTPPALPAAGDVNTGFDRVTLWTYDAVGRKQTEVVQGITTRFAYDKEGRLKTQTVAEGLAEQAAYERRYDALGRLREMREPIRKLLRSNTDFQNLANDLSDTWLYDQVATVNGYGYDAFGNIVASLRAGFTIDGNDQLVNYPGSESRLTLVRLDGQGRVIWEQEGQSETSKKITWREYDAADNVVALHHRLTLTELDGGRTDRITTTFEFDRTNRQLQTDVVRYEWNASQNTWQAYYRDERSRVIYNAFGEITDKKVLNDGPTQITDQRSYFYDKAGRITQSDDNETGVLRSHGYNLAGYKVWESRPTASGGTAVYLDQTDRLGRSTVSTLPRNADSGGNPQLLRNFDRWGNVLRVTDAEGHATDYTYDHRNQLLTETKAQVIDLRENGTEVLVRPRTVYTYDALGRLTQVLDANGHTRKTGYNKAGEVEWTEDGEFHRTLYAYNAVGEQAYQQDARDYITFKRYDDRGRITSTGDYLPNAQNSARTAYSLQTFTLNQDGHRLSVTNGENETQRYAYNSRGDLTRSRTAMGVEMTYRYDELGRKIEESYVGLNTTQTWGYDTKGHLNSHVDLGGRSYGYQYNAQGSLQSTTINGGATRTISYYDSGLVKQVTEGSSSTSYLYDKNGRIIEESTSTVDPGGAAVQIRTVLSYDSNGRLENVKRYDQFEQKWVLDLTYRYDAVGNRRKVEARSGYGPGVGPLGGVNSTPVFIGMSLPQGGVGNAYSQSIAAAFTDPDAGQTLSFVATGGLPPGMSLSSTGVLSGTPTQSGTFAISVTATDNGSPPRFVSGTLSLTIAANAPPVYTQIPQLNWTANIQNTFNVAAYFSDALGQTLSFAPNVALPAGITLSSTGMLSGTPTTAGTHTIQVRATDNGTPPESTVGSFTLVVAAGNQAPTYTQIPQQNHSGGQAFTLNAAAYFSDPNGHALSFQAVSGMPAGLQFSASGQFSGVPANGTYDITIRATDNGTPPQSVQQTFRLVVNGSPYVVLAGIPDQNVTAGAALPVGWSVAHHFADPEGQPLSFSAVRMVGGQPQALPVGLAFSSAGAFNGNFPSQAGTYTIRVTASDGTLSVWDEFNIFVGVNPSPVITQPIPTQTMGTLQLREFNLYQHFSDNNPLTFSLGAPPPAAGAGVSLLDGLLTLRPTAAGSYSVTVLASDGSNPAVPMTFTLQVTDVEGQAPRLNSNVPVQFKFERPATLGVHWLNLNYPFFSDPQGGAVSYELINFGVDTVGIYELQQTQSGLQLAYEWPEGGLVPTFKARIRATDAQGNSNHPDHDIFVTLTQGGSLNQSGPALRNGGLSGLSASATQGQSYSLNVSTYLNDSDGGVISSYIATGLPSGLTLNASTGVISGTTSVAPGTYLVRVTAMDNHGLRLSDTLRLVVQAPGQNQGPTYTQIPVQNLNAGQSFNLNAAGFFSDPDGHALSFSIVGSLPAGLSMNAAGQFSGVPTAGNYSITVRATDNGSPALSTQQTFTLNVQTVSNQVPVRRAGVSSFYTDTWQNGGNGWKSLPLLFQDPEGGALTYEIVDGAGNPSWEVSIGYNPGGTGLIVQGSLSGAPNDEFQFRIRARDPQGQANAVGDDVILTITVTGQPLEPNKSEDGLPLEAVTTTTTSVPVPLAPEAINYPPTVNVQEYWFTYDNENRVRIANGRLVNGQITLEAPLAGLDRGYMNVYDAVGNVEFVVNYAGTPGMVYSRRMGYDLRGQLVTTTNSQRVAANAWGTIDASDVIERREYDQAGRLLREIQVFAKNTVASWEQPPGEPQDYDISGFVRGVRNYTYDDDGRIHQQSSHLREMVSDKGVVSPWVKASHAIWIAGGPAADAEIALQMGHGVMYTRPEYWQSTTEYFNNGGRTGLGYDGGGRLLGFAAFSRDQSNGQPIVYRHTYQGWDSWQENTIVGKLQQAADEFSVTTTQSFYDAFGRRNRITEDNRRERANGSQIGSTTTNLSTRYLANNADGQIISRRDGRMENNVFKQGTDYTNSQYPPPNPLPHLISQATWNSFTDNEKRAEATRLSRLGANHEFVYAAGQQVAGLDENGAMDVISRTTGFSSSDTGTSTTQAFGGENLRAIARRVYGNEQLWYVLAAANGIDNDQVELTAGLTLNVPQVTTRLNDAATFRPYSASEATGSTLPNVPHIAAPPKAGCNALQIVVIVVAVIVTIYTAGAAAGAMPGTVAAGGTAAGTGTMAIGSSVLAGTATGIAPGAMMASAAIGGFAGSVAGQVTSMALGLSDGFSLRQAVAGGLTAGFGAGLGAAGLPGAIASKPWAAAASSAALNTVAGYAANRLAGVPDTHFSWRSVAASAVAAGISASVTPALVSGFDRLTQAGQFKIDLVSGTVGGVVSLHVGRAMGLKTAVNYGQIAVDAFGNALANVATGEAGRRVKAEVLERALSSVPTELHGTVQRLIANADEHVDGRELLSFVERYRDETMRSLRRTPGEAARVQGALGAEYINRFSPLNAEEKADATRVLEAGYGLKGHVSVGNLSASGITPPAVMQSTLSGPSGYGVTLDSVQAPAKPWLGFETLDSLLSGTGHVSIMVGQEIEERWYLKYSLIGAEIAAGPVVFAARQAVGATFEEQINTMQEGAIGYVGGELTTAGQSEDDARAGGVGALTLGMLAIGGVGGALLKLKSVSSRLESFSLFNRQPHVPPHDAPYIPLSQRGSIGPIPPKITVRGGFKAGEKGKWSDELNSPLKNSRYMIDGNAFQTDHLGRTIEVDVPRMRLASADRLESRQKAAGGVDRQATDAGGHLLGAQFGGPGEGINLVAMDRQLNGNSHALGKWGRLEASWADALRSNPNTTLAVNIRPVYRGDSLRPTSFHITQVLNGVTTTIRLKNRPGG